MKYAWRISFVIDSIFRTYFGYLFSSQASLDWPSQVIRSRYFNFERVGVKCDTVCFRLWQFRRYILFCFALITLKVPLFRYTKFPKKEV